jgi:hypothetical protein
VEFDERPGEAMLFQVVGAGATISPARQGVPRVDACNSCSLPEAKRLAKTRR